MRSTESQPENPWPHDMQLSIDEPYSLTYLLFVRQAWELGIDGVPELDPVPSIGASARPDSVGLDAAYTRWRAEWGRAWTQYEPIDRTTRGPDDETLRLLELPDDQLADAVSRMPSPFWDEGIDRPSYEEWRRSLRDDHSRPIQEHPERVCLDALIPAWRSGLLTVLQLPYRGYFAERINPTTLVVSRTTRHNPTLYRKALGTIGPRQ